MLEIRPFAPADHARWEVLARGYKRFYQTPLPDSDYEKTWQRFMQGSDVFGFGGHLNGELVGIAHYMFHTAAWSADVCYLQDLFVDERVRGQGVARALIEAVAAAARARGTPRYYWLTNETNTTARLLYDKIGQYKGFIRYDYALG